MHWFISRKWIPRASEGAQHTVQRANFGLKQKITHINSDDSNIIFLLLLFLNCSVFLLLLLLLLLHGNVFCIIVNMGQVDNKEVDWDARAMGQMRRINCEISDLPDCG
jgi:hypothetical protein